MLLGWSIVINDSPPRDHLEEHHSKAVDVGLGGELPRGCILGCTVPVGAHHLSRGVGVVADVAHLSQPEIGELGIEFLVEKNVGGLEIAVYDRRVGLLVQVLEPHRCPSRNLHPRLPVQGLLA